MTEELREKAKEILEDKYPEICRVYTHNLWWYYSEPKELLAFIEREIIEAERRAKADIIKKITDYLPDDEDYSQRLFLSFINKL